MKRFLFLVMVVVALASCSKDNEEPSIIDEYDLVPVEFLFDITNAEGESLIDKDSPTYDSVFIANTYIKFQGKEYKMEEDAKVDVKPTTRAYYERFHGIMIEQQFVYGTNETKTLVRIGPFLSDYDWESEEIDIHWGDNSEDKIVFTSVITSRPKNQIPTFSRKFLFNGKDCTDALFGYYNHMQLVKEAGKEN